MNTILKTGLTLFLYFILISVNAQQSLVRIKKNTIFLEVFGNGNLYSINYDKLLSIREKWIIAGRVGISYFNHTDPSKKQYVVLPTELSYLRGKDKHFLEIGYGFTMMLGRNEKYQGESATSNYVEGLNVFRLGYRYQQKKGGMFYKIGWTPGYGMVYQAERESSQLDAETYYKPFNFGFGIGYTFK